MMRQVRRDVMSCGRVILAFCLLAVGSTYVGVEGASAQETTLNAGDWTFNVSVKVTATAVTDDTSDVETTHTSYATDPASTTGLATYQSSAARDMSSSGDCPSSSHLEGSAMGVAAAGWFGNAQDPSHYGLSTSLPWTEIFMAPPGNAAYEIAGSTTDCNGTVPTNSASEPAATYVWLPGTPQQLNAAPKGTAHTGSYTWSEPLGVFTALYEVTYTAVKRVDCQPGTASGCDEEVTLEWGVEPRMEDTNNDGILDNAYVEGRLSDELSDNQTLDVVLDACPAQVVVWRIGSAEIRTPNPVCRITFPGVTEGVHTASVTTIDSNEASIQIDPQHLMIVGLGDSYGSGEGVPHLIQGSQGQRPRWDQKVCHRSRYSSQAQAALRLEKADDRSAVTFLHLACSGATTKEGVLGRYQGAQPPSPEHLEEAQVVEASDATLGNPIDAVFLSLGGNDIGFADIIKTCLSKPTPCPLVKKQGKTLHDRTQKKLRPLGSSYDKVNACLVSLAANCVTKTSLGVAPSHVFHTEYPDLAQDEKGDYCDKVLTGIADEELKWATEVVQQGKAQTMYKFKYQGDQSREFRIKRNGLNRQIASRANWTPVEGIFNASRRHGYCSKSNWVVQMGQSLKRQGNEQGAFQPNLAGQTAYGKILAARALAVLGLA